LEFNNYDAFGKTDSAYRFIENTWKISQAQIRRWYPNSAKTTDIIIHRFQVKEILNLIIVNPVASRFNIGTPPPCKS